ncbi:dephospho-CoA kinase [Aurantibacillus circumpalustris]|uniref:dephospho-CoA kinase n=1 Tax=Aurantibacillus circumpalustris TaxID=3036359 RepID=UPI00295B36CE|nr:dephospho-CoA kinase [Aurantibacillus circumpalustris]
MVAGLTGGIGSGKTTVAKLFELLGCAVFESDEVARSVYYQPEIKSKVIQLLGPESYSSDTCIDKKFISTKIFSDTDLLQQLNAIIHPAVIAKSKQFIAEHPNKLIIKETALLFEAHLEKDVDKIILVVAKDETRIKRVMQRDGLTHEEVEKKIKSQLPQSEKIKKADFIIYNDETELVIPQVIKIYKALNELPRRR